MLPAFCWLPSQERPRRNHGDDRKAEQEYPAACAWVGTSSAYPWVPTWRAGDRGRGGPGAPSGAAPGRRQTCGAPRPADPGGGIGVGRRGLLGCIYSPLPAPLPKKISAKKFLRKFFSRAAPPRPDAQCRLSAPKRSWGKAARDFCL